jgi:hypothetical protein
MEFPLGQSGPANTPPSSGPSQDWIQQALQNVQSTDDPGYWQNVIRQHNDYDNPAARNYWVDRINRGDGSNLVKSGQLQKVQDNPGGLGSGGGLAQILQMLLGGQMSGSQNMGAQPYNPHFRQYNPNGGFDNQAQHLQQQMPSQQPGQGQTVAGSTNGTLIGTTGMSNGPTFNQNPTPFAGRAQQNPVMGMKPKPFAMQNSSFGQNGINNSQNTPMGAPTFYQNGNPLSQSRKNDSTSYSNNSY